MDYDYRRELGYIDTEEGRMVLLYHGIDEPLTAETLDGKIVEEIGYTPLGLYALSDAFEYCRKAYIDPHWHYVEC